jgi:predicted nucleic acid-binding protein
MIVITDSNVIFSALRNPNGTVAKIFNDKSNIQFLAPDFLIDEIKKHINKIVITQKRNKKDILNDFDVLLTKIEIIKTIEIPKKNILEAIEIVKDIDIDDVLFVALHKYKKHKIWTSDKILISGLENKGFFICITTSELKESLYKK